MLSVFTIYQVSIERKRTWIADPVKRESAGARDFKWTAYFVLNDMIPACLISPINFNSPIFVSGSGLVIPACVIQPDSLTADQRMSNPNCKHV